MAFDQAEIYIAGKSPIVDLKHFFIQWTCRL